MPTAPFDSKSVADPESLGIDPGALEALFARVQRDVDSGVLPSCQLALARDGRLAAFRSFGAAPTESRYVMFSATKAVVAGAVWILMGEGSLDVTLPVASIVPEFAANGKDAITVAQVMLHTSGFPACALRRARLGRPRAAARAVLEVAAQLGARDALRVPPDVGALGAGRDHRTLHGHRLPLRSSAHASSTRSGSRVLQVGVPLAEQGDMQRSRR